MHKLYAEKILIGSDWQSDITLSIASNGKILSIDTGRDVNAVCLNGTVLPGMVNCHSHTFQRAFAGFSEYRSNSRDSFWSWRDIMYRFVGKMTPDDLHTIAKFVYIEMLKAGYTSVGEFHYLHHQPDGTPYDNASEMSEQVIEAASSAGIAITHLPVLYSYSGFGEKAPTKAQGRFIHSTQTYLRIVERLSKQYSHFSNFSLGIAPHSLRAVSKNQLRQIIPAIRSIDVNSPIHIHIAEQSQEVEDCIDFYNDRPVDWLLDNFEVDNNWCLVHATHITDSEVTKIANSGAVVGLCPLTEANLGDGIFPTAEYLKQGGKFAIGSDSHIGINVAEELRLLEYAQRLVLKERAVLVNDDCSSVGQFLYSNACKHGAATINQEVGVIGVGKRADLVVLDNDEASLFCKEGSFVLDAAIFACDKLPVKDVFVAGRLIIESGHHQQDQEIKNEYHKVLKRLTA